ncbi:MAG: hydrogenase maturation protease [Promethearchaeota archaeon]
MNLKKNDNNITLKNNNHFDSKKLILKNKSNIPQKIIDSLKSIVEDSKRILVLGIGDNKLSDDGFGPYIVSHFYINLKQKNLACLETNSHKIKFMNGKTHYSERMNEVLEFNPDLILILDTCDSGDPAGTVIFVDESKFINVVPISTHVIPIHIFIGQLKNKIPGLKTYLLGVNPFSLDFPEKIDFFMPDKFDLDDYEEDLDLPFYSFYLTEEMKAIADDIIEILKNIFNF